MESCNEAALVAAAVEGLSLAGIAEAAGVSVSTVQRRLRLPEIRRQISESRSRLRDEAVGQLGHVRLRALNRLSEIVEDDDPKIALRAIALVLTNSAKFEQIQDLDVRIGLLEESILAGDVSDDSEASTAASVADGDQAADVD